MKPIWLPSLKRAARSLVVIKRPETANGAPSLLGGPILMADDPWTRARQDDRWNERRWEERRQDSRWQDRLDEARREAEHGNQHGHEEWRRDERQTQNAHSQRAERERFDERVQTATRVAKTLVDLWKAWRKR